MRRVETVAGGNGFMDRVHPCHSAEHEAPSRAVRLQRAIVHIHDADFLALELQFEETPRTTENLVLVDHLAAVSKNLSKPKISSAIRRSSAFGSASIIAGVILSRAVMR